MLKKLLFLLLMVIFGTQALAVSLNGAGATFPAPIYSKWFDLFAQETGINVNYQAIGSGGGVRQFTNGVVDFGASDAFMSEKEIDAAGGDVLHIPTVMGSVAIVYNLPVSGIKLDPRALAGIYLGKITNWNDPDISELNPGKSLPNKKITVVHRSDGSGTTSIFTN
ncbi:MAG: phosphate ABC transporter substrate-binding protein PstS, partial [Candidatus Margulisiibacteriota bacterium]